MTPRRPAVERSDHVLSGAARSWTPDIRARRALPCVSRRAMVTFTKSTSRGRSRSVNPTERVSGRGEDLMTMLPTRRAFSVPRGLGLSTDRGRRARAEAVRWGRKRRISVFLHCGRKGEPVAVRGQPVLIEFYGADFARSERTTVSQEGDIEQLKALDPGPRHKRRPRVLPEGIRGVDEMPYPLLSDSRWMSSRLIASSTAKCPVRHPTSTRRSRGGWPSGPSPRRSRRHRPRQVDG